MVLDETSLRDLYEKSIGCSEAFHTHTYTQKIMFNMWGKLKEKKFERRYLSNNLSSRFISCDVSLLTMITYFWAIQRGLQYFYGPFL